MNAEKQKLIRDLLDDQSDIRREATLTAGAHTLRQRRRRRIATRSVLGVALVAMLAAALHWKTNPHKQNSVAIQPAPEPALEGQSLTDSELLALFPDTPVGLITLDDGRKRLVFLRSSDEARFVKRL